MAPTLLKAVATASIIVLEVFAGSLQITNSPTPGHRRGIKSTYASTCQSIASAISPASAVYNFGAIDYFQDIKHFMTSSMQYPACVVEVGCAQDVSVALKIVGASRTPFAIQSGGHACNQGFSSTTGVHFSNSRLQQIKLSADKSYIDIGPGNIWDNVYKALEGTGVNVVGGRVSGVGVGGFISGGGGYSWKTNSAGLSVDTVISFTAVLPNGTIATIDSSNPDLFFAFKGGINNYGYITNFRLRTVPQTPTIYGGLRTYTYDKLDALIQATNDFSANNKDPKAQIIPTFNFVLGQPGVALLTFYDAPTAPKNTFAGFDAIKTFSSDMSTRSFSSFVKSAPAGFTSGNRGAFHTVQLKAYSLPLLQQIVNQTKYYGNLGLLHTASFISYDVEPFLEAYKTYSSGGAWPHSDGGLPLNLYFSWVSSLEDAFWQAEIVKSANLIKAQAIAEGQDLSSSFLYPNYATASTPIEALYGPNLPRMRAIKAKVDPTNVMGLTGGFKV